MNEYTANAALSETNTSGYSIDVTEYAKQGIADLLIGSLIDATLEEME